MRRRRMMIALMLATVGVIALASLTPGVQAAAMYYSGSGTWDDGTTANWATSSGGTYNQAWVGGSNPHFEGTAGTVSVSGTISSVYPMYFDVDGYTLEGGAINMTHTTGRDITVAAGEIGTTINSVLTSSNAVRVQKQGTGTLILGGANTYSGNLNIKGGRVEVSAISDTTGETSNIGTNAATNGVYVKYGTQFAYTGSANVTTTRELWMDDGNATASVIDVTDPDATLTWSPTTGLCNNRFTKIGDGTLVLGVTITGANSRVDSQAGKLVLTAANTFSGRVSTRNDGIISVSAISDTAGQTSNIGTAGGSTNFIQMLPGGTFEYTGSANVTTTRDLWLDSGAGDSTPTTITVIDAGATLTLSPGNGGCDQQIVKRGSGDLVFNLGITGGNGVDVYDGTLTLGGANSYAGDTAVHGGALEINSAYLSDAADVYVDSGATLDLGFTGTDTIATFYLDGVAQAIGTWGALGSSADYTTNHLTGDGLLNVTIPEPGTVVLLSIGLIGMLAYAWRKRK